MQNGRNKQPTEAADAAAAVSDFLDVMSDLKDILSAENDFLRRGLPAGLSELNSDKMRLAQLYELSTQKFLAEHSKEVVSDPALYQQVVAAGHELHALGTENMQRVSAAIEATKSRIEAVMSAIRKHDGVSQGYGKNGVRSARAASFLKCQPALQPGRNGKVFEA